MQPRKTRKIRIGNVVIGGDSPIAVQSMAATQTQDLDATARQIAVSYTHLTLPTILLV